MTLTPAYGRDYKSAAAVKKDWAEGKDFIIADFFDPNDGKPINIEDARRAGISKVGIRYKQLTQQVFVPC